MTTLLRWDPLRDVQSLQTELARLLSGMSGGSNDRQVQAWTPALDVWESENSVTYSFDLPRHSSGRDQHRGRGRQVDGLRFAQPRERAGD